ncbi:F0F1 ATP synthase subunit delta [Micropruina sonneratiae]|uniref:F0F1 ATP synthase subunit delta n=1 Tax=Micropruina sonneratiae TaxID=2986940 RepID=UPI002225CCBF|nr:F0F1 ATP synthase subunit delta [Micropruina sp. KQZ13P-5]MCW3157537.1 F0F1 ATP synthase subunit delta [Micropruina sp. KQZ13P-5]
MSSTHEARLGELDGVLTQQQITPELGEELFALVDLLDSNPALRRALTDTGAETSAREALVDALFGQRISAGSRAVFAAAVAQRWGSTSALSAALERQGVRAVLATAQQAGTLDNVQDELFRFERLVAADRGLQAALSDRTAPLETRRQLVDDLLATRADAATTYLAKRAVAARRRSFELTIDEYLTLAAALRQRAVAHVVVARPLTDEQAQRLVEVLGRQVGREVTLQVEVDPHVVGGVRVTVGDEIIDGTVAGRLEHARRQLS